MQLKLKELERCVLELFVGSIYLRSTAMDSKVSLLLGGRVTPAARCRAPLPGVYACNLHLCHRLCLTLHEKQACFRHACRCSR